MQLRIHKLKFKLNFMKRISMLEFRKDARRALAAVRRGEPLLLTYRGRPVARLEPVRESGDVPEGDALLRVDAFAVDGPGHPLENDEIDRVVYGA
jgi:prevent-host-death family protein